MNISFLDYRILVFIKKYFQFRLITYWVACCITAVMAVNKQIKEAKKASTIIRKIFHILSVAVFLPGLLYKCSLTYLASGVVLGIFIMLEVSN